MIKKHFTTTEAYKEDTYLKIEPVYSVIQDKLVFSIDQVLDQLKLKDNMTISFHHHLRNGDAVLNKIIEHLDNRNLINITLAASSLFPVHEPIIKAIKKGTISKIVTSYLNGPVAKAVSQGMLKDQIIMQTHGGRARSIETGEMVIDVAFIALSCADKNGNGNGKYGNNAFGPVGYSIADMMYAKQVVVVTDHLVDDVFYPEIEAKYVDYVLKVDSIGDQAAIVSGTTQITKDPIGIKIAKDTTKILDLLGLIKPGFSMQTGAGGVSLAVASEVYQIMKERNIKGSFISGGITGYFVKMLEEDKMDQLYDVQCFDLEAVRSYRENKNHIGMSASKYANPFDSPVVNNLDFTILGATEIDVDYNVNVTTDSFGYILGGSGGHADSAYGAKVTIITTQLMKSRMPIIKDRVTTITTPGDSVDILVTERGISINPKRVDLINQLKDKIKLSTIQELQETCYRITGRPVKIEHGDKVIGIIEYRDGSIIDYLYKK
ncbi:MAG: citrate lyase subunit alpha [Acholeplasmataceae bacterium]|jgi:citrate lyase subunit alpha/citrate CoA-transferase|nr:citrate lyase subunit alpha [Acholeplasmataceae bacterium]